jgi:DNA-binding transcriptional LysR family regulator
MIQASATWAGLAPMRSLDLVDADHDLRQAQGADLARWNVDRPDVTVALRESTDPEAAYAMLESGEADLLLFPDLLFDDAGFETTTVAEEEVVVALPPRHPLAARDAIRPRDLQGQPFVHFTPENRLGTWIESHLKDLDLRGSVVVRTAVTSHAPQLAAAGLGVTVVPVSAIAAGFSGAVRPLEPQLAGAKGEQP